MSVCRVGGFQYLFSLFQEQYIFIHDAILESVTCGDTEIPSANLMLVLQKLIENNPQDNMSMLQTQFKVTYHLLVLNLKANIMQL